MKTIQERLAEMWRSDAKARRRPSGEGKHSRGKHPPRNWRLQLRRLRKAQRNHRKRVRRMKAGRKHRE